MINIKLAPRATQSRFWIIAAQVIAISLLLAISALVFALLGFPVGTALWYFYIAPLSSLDGLSELFLKTTPLAICAFGLAIGFRASVWNIGAEGQLVMGGVFAGACAIYLSGTDIQFAWMIALLCGALGGAAWAAIPAYLRVQWSTNEILTSLMFVYVAQFVLLYLVGGPLRDPNGYNFPQSQLFDLNALAPLIAPGYRLNWVFLLVPIFAIAYWFFVSRASLGLKMRVGGISPAAARYIGYSQGTSVWTAFLISGAAAGVAGAAEVLGPIGQLQTTISPGYGFSAIIVAFAGRMSTIGILLNAVLLSLMYLGGESVRIYLSAPASLTFLFQGLMLFLILVLDLPARYKVTLQWRSSGARTSAVQEGG